ncbi:hypothetical protein P280DRAFT_476540 [Massarina eburnea CBS 473.64]|uniref:Uncharacterized protein n=1 Tax=Massarina eburnea CBS 473.64 TaxID=1395130 RepID=A0A6A6SBC1_9PLEO|nr:hypothetical protein P280DRAFT_476540 [Massarina eburnea CBS 473.64]
MSSNQGLTWTENMMLKATAFHGKAVRMCQQFGYNIDSYWITVELLAWFVFLEFKHVLIGDLPRVDQFFDTMECLEAWAWRWTHEGTQAGFWSPLADAPDANYAYTWWTHNFPERTEQPSLFGALNVLFLARGSELRGYRGVYWIDFFYMVRCARAYFDSRRASGHSIRGIQAGTT